MAEREESVRKVFMLPQELVERINEYRHEHNIDSEVEAVRRLLDGALLHRDTTSSILAKLMAKFKTEKDLRVIARDVLATHPLVESISYRPDSVAFEVKDDFKALIDREGKAFICGIDKKWVEMFLSRDGTVSPKDDDIPF